MNVTAITGGIVLGVAAGFAGGYFFAKRSLTSQIWEEAMVAAQEEIDISEKKFREASFTQLNEDLKEHHESVGDLEYVSRLVEETPVEELEALHEDYRPKDQPVVNYHKINKVEKNIFDEFGDEPNDEPTKELEFEDTYVEVPEELSDLPSHIRAQRETGGPYVMVASEFYGAEEEGISTSQITYYARDDVFADWDDSPISNAESVFGEDTKDCFGIGSDEEHVVYIMNPSLRAAYEIIFEEGAWKDNLIAAQNDRIERDAKAHRRKAPKGDG